MWLGWLGLAIAGDTDRAWLRDQLGAHPLDIEPFRAMLVAGARDSEDVMPVDRKARSVLVAVSHGSGPIILHFLSMDGGARALTHRLDREPLCAAALSASGIRLAHGRLVSRDQCEVELVEVASGTVLDRFVFPFAELDRPVAFGPENVEWFGDDALLYVAAGTERRAPMAVRLHALGSAGPDPQLVTIGEAGATVSLQQIGRDLLVTTLVAVGDERRTTIDRVDLLEPAGWVRLANLDSRDTVLGAAEGGFLIARLAASGSVIGRIDRDGNGFEPRATLRGIWGAVSGGVLYFRTREPSLHVYDAAGDRLAELPVPAHHFPTLMLGDPQDPELVYGSWGFPGGSLVHVFDPRTSTHRTLTDPSLPTPSVAYRTEALGGHPVSLAWTGDPSDPRPVAVICRNDRGLFYSGPGARSWRWWLERGGRIAAVLPAQDALACRGDALVDTARALLADGRARADAVFAMGSGGTFDAVRSAPDVFAGAVIVGRTVGDEVTVGLPPLLWELSRESREDEIAFARSVSSRSSRFVVPRSAEPDELVGLWAHRLAFVADIAGMTLGPP